MCALCGECCLTLSGNILVMLGMPIIRRSDCVPLPIVVCHVVAVVILESRVARYVHCVENVA